MGKHDTLAHFAVGWHCSTNTGTMATLFQELTAAGCEIGSHESDLHVKVCEKADTIIAHRMSLPSSTLTLREMNRPSQFVSNIDGELWWDIPFAYDPFWENKTDARRGFRGEDIFGL